MKNIKNFFKSLLDPTQNVSIKSFAMLVAIAISIFLSICLGYSMILDTWVDGILNIDLIDVGVFMTCLGSFMTLAALPKTIIDNVKTKKGVSLGNEESNNEEN